MINGAIPKYLISYLHRLEVDPQINLDKLHKSFRISYPHENDYVEIETTSRWLKNVGW